MASNSAPGSARVTQEASEREYAASAQQETEARDRILARNRQVVERQMEDMRAELDANEKEALGLSINRTLQQKILASDRSVMAKRRS